MRFSSRRRVHPWPLVALLFGLILFYLGERLFPGSTAARVILDALGGALLIGGVVQRLRERAVAGDTLKAVLGTVLVFQALVLVGIALHWLAVPAVVDGLNLSAEGAERYRGVVTVLWPIVLACGVLPLAFLEISLISTSRAPVLEVARVRRSAEAGLILALVLSLLFALNFLAEEHNVREDLSYSKTTQPSDATLLLVQSFSEPVRIVLFFPASNEVEEEVLPYFEALAAASELVTLERVDHDAEPALAKELKARKNGTVVLARGENTESLVLGTDEDKAKSKLRKLDKEIHKKLTKVAKPQLVAYLTTGHGERDWAKVDPGDDGEAERMGLKDLKTLLQMFNYKVERLGIAEGLASEVPDDASVVMIVGPTTELLDEEAEALLAYLARGGSVMVFLDPEQEVTLEPLLGPLGVTFHRGVLAHESKYIPKTGQISDRRLLYTTKYSAHPSTKRLQKNSSRYPTVVVGAGYLETTAGADGEAPEVVLKSQPKTFADLDGDLSFDDGEEERKIYDLAVAVELAAAPEGGEEGAHPGRALVYADADMVSDLALRNEGNTNVVADAIKWTGGEEELAGEVASEEDVKILHTRKQDIWWFYSTTFAIPLAVIGVGVLVVVRRGSRRERR